MNLFKAARSFSFGLLIAIFAIGLLPFLLIFCLGDIYGLNEMYESRFPFFKLFQ